MAGRHRPALRRCGSRRDDRPRRDGTGEDRAHVIGALATPRDRDGSSASMARSRGFVIRAPWGGGATVAAIGRRRPALIAARRVAAGPAGRVRVGILAENDVGLASLIASRVHGILVGAAHDPRRAAGLAPRVDLGPVQPRDGLTALVARMARPLPPSGLERAARLGEVDPVVAGEHPEHQVVALRAALPMDADPRPSAGLERRHSAMLPARSGSNPARSSVGIVVAVEPVDPQVLVVADQLGPVVGEHPAIARRTSRARRRRCGRGTGARDHSRGSGRVRRSRPGLGEQRPDVRRRLGLGLGRIVGAERASSIRW